MAEEVHPPEIVSKYTGLPRSLYPQIKKQIAERSAALETSINQQKRMVESSHDEFNAAQARIQASIDELQAHLDECKLDLNYINRPE